MTKDKAKKRAKELNKFEKEGNEDILQPKN